jgi:hypothetical protein
VACSIRFCLGEEGEEKGVLPHSTFGNCVSSKLAIQHVDNKVRNHLNKAGSIQMSTFSLITMSWRHASQAENFCQINKFAILFLQAGNGHTVRLSTP